MQKRSPTLNPLPPITPLLTILCVLSYDSRREGQEQVSAQKGWCPGGLTKVEEEFELQPSDAYTHDAV